MAFRVIANEILRNPEIINDIATIGDVPLSQIRTSIISDIQRERIESQGIATLFDLVNYPNIRNLAQIGKLTEFSLLKLISAVNLLLKGSSIQQTSATRTDKKISFIKIVFFGLDQAGKTSLIQFIKKTEPLTVLKERLPETRPTVGVDYQKLIFHEIPILLQELGGQITLRESNFQRIPSLFKGCHIGVFVIDSTDVPRLVDALDYFKQVNLKLKELNYNFPIKIAVHKADKGLIVETSELMNELIYNLSMELDISLIDLMNSVFTTSIRNPYSISSFFSHIIESTLPIRSYITNGLSTITSLYPLDFCCLIDPSLSRIPLGWVSKLEDLDPKTLINYILEYTEHFLIKPKNGPAEKLKKSHFTVKINNFMKELTYSPVFLPYVKKEYYFVYAYADDWEASITPDMPSLESLVVKALDPQLKMALLAITSQKENLLE